MGPFNPRVRSSSTERQVKNWFNFVSSGTGGGASINSIQQGVITIGSGALSATATISSVNTSRSFLSSVGFGTDSTSGFTADNMAYLTLTNATTLTATRGVNSESSILVIGYYIVEFLSGIASAGVGTITILSSGAHTTGTATISSVNTAKTLLSCTGSANASGGANGLRYMLPYLQLTNATTITASLGGSNFLSNTTVGYSYIELQ